MFKTHMGPVEDERTWSTFAPRPRRGCSSTSRIVQQTSRKKIPFGIAQIGKSFRNEITPGNFIFRTREFEQMEMEYFVEPGTDEEWLEYWIEERMQWYLDLGIPRRTFACDRTSPTSSRTTRSARVDIEYAFP